MLLCKIPVCRSVLTGKSMLYPKGACGLGLGGIISNYTIMQALRVPSTAFRLTASEISKISLASESLSKQKSC